MTNTEALNLTRIMLDEAILRIARNPNGYSVYLEGDILGTGKDVGEAFRNAIRQRLNKQAAERRRAA